MDRCILVASAGMLLLAGCAVVQSGMDQPVAKSGGDLQELLGKAVADAIAKALDGDGLEYVVSPPEKP